MPPLGGGRFDSRFVVRYSEDSEGRGWTVVGPYDYGRYTIRRRIGPHGPLECIAEAEQIASAPVE